MFALVLIFVFVGFGLILVASFTGTAAWAWMAVAVSGAAAAILVTDWMRRWTAAGDGDRVGLPAPGVRPTVGYQVPAPRPAAPAEDPVTEVFSTVSLAEPTTDTVEAADRADPVAEVTEDSDEPIAPPTETLDEFVEPDVLAILATLDDEVFVVDEQPRYHLADCRSLVGQKSLALPAKDAVDCEFTPCGMCTPVRILVNAKVEASEPRS